MKKYFVLFSIIVCQRIAAQPVLQESGLGTVGTMTGNVFLGQVVNAGNPGDSLTWDFSTATLIPYYTLGIVDPATTPFADTFPSSNYCLALYSSALGDQYNYYVYGNGKLETIGENITSSGGNNFTPDTRLELQFPFTFLDFIYDSWERTDSVSGNVTVLYDGYGTLITPFGTYDNVVRVNFNDGEQQKFIWYNSNPIYPIWTFVSPDSFSIAVDLNPVGIENQSSENLSATIFPSPAQNDLTINFNKPVDMNEARVRVYCVLGNEMNPYSLSQKSPELISLDVHQLPPGIYLLQLEIAHEQISRRFVIE